MNKECSSTSSLSAPIISGILVAMRGQSALTRQGINLLMTQAPDFISAALDIGWYVACAMGI